MRRKVARGATEWRDATQQLSVSCVSAVTEATAAARAEAEGITTTEAVGAAESSVAVATALEDQSGVRDGAGGRGTTPVQIRHSRVNGRTAHVIYGTFINGARARDIIPCCKVPPAPKPVTQGQVGQPDMLKISSLSYSSVVLADMYSRLRP